MAAVDIEVIARLARLASAAQQPYLVARTIPILAQTQPKSAEWILGYLKTLVQLGLNAAAGQLVDLFPENLKCDPAVAELIRGMAEGQSGNVPWSSRRRRFDANLVALSACDAELADQVRDTWATAVDRFEMHQCRDGNIAVCRAESPWPPTWIPSLDDHKTLASRRTNTARDGTLPPPLIFEGVGLGWEILDAYEKTRRVFLDASAAIYIVEPNIEALAIVLHLHDWRTILADDSVRWFTHTEATARLLEALERDASWAVTDRYCFAGSLDAPACGEVNTVMRQVGAARMKRANKLRTEVAHRYAGRDAAYWANRFADDTSSQPLRILGVTSLNTTFLQYSMRDCLAALEALGHETQLLIEPAPHRVLDPVDALQAQLDFEPDVVLILSRMRYEMKSLIHEAIPSVTWDQDALPWVFDETHSPQLADNDFLMGYAAANAEEKFGWPTHHLKYCTMAGSPHTYAQTPLPDDVLKPFRCDVSYVSHASATVDQEAAHAETWLPDEGPLHHLFRATLPRVIPQWNDGGAFPGSVVPAVVATAAQMGLSVNAAEITKVNLALLRVGDRAFRHVALQWVADWADRTGRTLHIRGNGWDEHPRLARYAHSATANGEDLRKVYQASKINLQLMGYGFLHQRALDGLMASAFFMTRRSNADDSGPALRELLGLLDAHNVTDAPSLARVRDRAVRQEIESRILKINGDPRILNPEAIDGWRSTVAGDFADEIVPHFGDIAFSSREDFEDKVERFLAQPDTRRQYAAAMRTALVDRYSYETRMTQMIDLLRSGFAIEAQRPCALA